MKSGLVRRAYDQMADKYLASRGRLKTSKYISRALKLMPKQSVVLDLGCGAGYPVDDIFLKSGHEVIGLDISSKQIQLARKLCPKGQYLVGDILDLKNGEYQCELVVSFYTMFHLPRDKQANVLKVFASFLKPKGLLLITMGDRAFEGEHELYGETLWSSQFGTVDNMKMIESAGFSMVFTEMDNSGGERHQVILAQKN